MNLSPEEKYWFVRQLCELRIDPKEINWDAVKAMLSNLAARKAG